MGCCGSVVVAGVVGFFFCPILWCFSGSGGDGFGGFFMFCGSLGMFFMFQNLCEWRERQMPPFDLVFLFYFLFWEEKDIKFEQKYLFIPNFNRGGLRKTNGT